MLNEKGEQVFEQTFQHWLISTSPSTINTTAFVLLPHSSVIFW